MVIAILAAISIVAYNGIQNRAASTTLQSDLRNAASQLGLAHADNGVYPTGSSLPSGIDSSDNNTLYYNSSDGSDYCLTAVSSRSGVPAYTLSNGGGISEGSCPGHPVGGGGDIALTCPTGFIPVPGNPAYGTSDFCVMQYEAKNVGGTATSQAAGTPWVSISQTNAKTAAQTACDGCKLITDPEWMTIAMNVISNPDNWSGGSVGSGTINRGNSNSSAAMDGTNELSGINKRTHTLTNGEVIWDLAGNVREWTDATITTGQPGITGQSGGAWNDYSHANLQWNSLPATSRPAGTLYAGTAGVGRLYSNPVQTGARAFRRGGVWDNGASAGVWTLNLSAAPGGAPAYIGFRASR